MFYGSIFEEEIRNLEVPPHPTVVEREEYIDFTNRLIVIESFFFFFPTLEEELERKS